MHRLRTRQKDHIDPKYPLYDASLEHDACGTGFLAQISGEASHEIIEMALQALCSLTHRGAQDADAQTNDGAGLLTGLPRLLLTDELQLSDPSTLAVGMLFLPSRDRLPEGFALSIDLIEQTLQDLHLNLLCWREPPIDANILGTRARATAPTIRQILLRRPDDCDQETYERQLYRARRLIEKCLQEANLTDCFVASLSSATIVYKGLLSPTELSRFYLDLADPRYQSSFAIFHQRYSTNTFPAWPLAQPMHLLAHNGEINTLTGNRNWMRAREGSLRSPLWNEQIEDLLPLARPLASDSAQLDAALELLRRSGRDLLHSMQMLIPPAWEQDPDLDGRQRAWCEYHAGLIEPWDGPAALIFGDGRFVGAALDRNGLRPARYTLTASGLLMVASEAGVLSCEPSEIVERGRLGPGQMLAVDLRYGTFLRDKEIKTFLAQQQPYQQWLDQHLVRLHDLPQRSGEQQEISNHPLLEPEKLFRNQQLFGFTHEDVELVLRPILAEQKEPIWSMGDDTPLAMVSRQSRSLSDYFHQRFAQVTNPPIDPLRERIVMSLDSYLGPRPSILTETPEHARLIHLRSPLLMESQLEELLQISKPFMPSQVLRTCFKAHSSLETALDQLQEQSVEAVRSGISLLILNDQPEDEEQAPIPMLLAVSAVNQALIRSGLRFQVSLICESNAVCDVHQIALLLGYGAEVIVPRLALASVRALAGERRLEHLTPEDAAYHYLHVVEDGLRKVMARMGISTIRNSIGGGQFEILGLSQEVIDRCFVGSVSYPGVVGLEDLAKQTLERWQQVRSEKAEEQEASVETARKRRRGLKDLGIYRFRREAEYHAYNPFIVRTLQKAAQTGDREDYQKFTDLVYQRPPTALRDLLTFVPTAKIPLNEVEPMEAIRARFVVSAMSLGALSVETHKAIAAAMNSIGGRNNTGEGGEDPDWYHETLEGYPIASKIKQIASARFGVTPEYLVRAEELEIKMAQGAKPGEGGQLPPHKVTPFIARLRHTAPGVSLISPPPHHDIYSIEDLAQLIYDLRQINPTAKIGVKLVSSIGVGTIAAGVAKAHADYVQISGHDGGTGASPMQSIKHAGIPWERGLAEAQQTLLKNGLRGRIKVRVDGGLKTGRDVIIGALLGAEEFGFGTGVLVALGCDMARQCHLNTCPAGIATQREDLRAKFTGRPQFVINYLTQVAEEVRRLMAQLGFRRLDDLIGRADLLQGPEEETEIDLAPMLVAMPGIKVREQVSPPPSDIAEALLQEAETAFSEQHSILVQHSIHNYDRAIGVSLAGEIARRYGNVGLTRGSVTAVFQGAAGQSFGAFTTPGMRLILQGEANDYIGKGMAGGQLILMPPADVNFSAHQNIILGNTALYGATGGQLFAAGCAGERFAVRNSGALAIVEGVGAHACEYMTGGMVVVLGETGRNFGAGMSAGIAYVLDLDGRFRLHCNSELVDLLPVDEPFELEALRRIVQQHHKKTRSWRASQILAEWSRMKRAFLRVTPYGEQHTAGDYVEAVELDASLASGS